MRTKEYTTIKAVEEIRQIHTDEQLLKYGVVYIQTLLLELEWPPTYAISKALPAYAYLISGKDVDNTEKNNNK